MNLDDDTYLTQNPGVSVLSWQSVGNLFTKPHEDLYKPLTLLSFAIEKHFFGLNPFVYHTNNLILHFLNTLLVWVIVALLTKREKIAWITAIVFAIHPLRVESVVWITERKDVLYGFFYLLAIVAYLKNKRPLSLLLFVLSLLSKPIAVTLPLALAAIEIYRRRDLRRVGIELLPYFLISAFFALLTIYVAKEGRETDPIRVEAFYELFLTPCWSILFYLEKFVAPFALSVAYPHPWLDTAWLKGIYFLSSILLLFIFIVLWRIPTIGRALTGCLGLFIVMSLPVIQIIPTSPASLVNDHNTYLPSIALAIACAFIFHHLEVQWPSFKQFFKFLGISLVIGWGILTFQQSTHWITPMRLWNHIITHYPAMPFAFNHRGNIYIEAGRYSDALEDFNRAVKFSPDNAESYNNRGNVYGLLGQYDKSIADFNHAEKLRPTMAAIYANRANIHLFNGNTKEAGTDYALAMKYDPNLIEIYSNRGNYYYLQGEYDKAFSDFDRSIQLNPSFARGYHNRGSIWSQLRKPQLAIADYSKAIEIDSTVLKTYVNRGNEYAKLGEWVSALRDFDHVLALDPNEFNAYAGKGAVLTHQKHYVEAIQAFDQSLRYDSNNAITYNNRGSAYQAMGMYDHALKDFTHAIEINSSYTNAYNNRGNLHLNLKNYPSALQDLTRAIEINPQYVDARINRAQTYLEIDQNTLAIEDFNAALTIPTISPEIRSYVKRKLASHATST